MASNTISDLINYYNYCSVTMAPTAQWPLQLNDRAAIIFTTLGYSLEVWHSVSKIDIQHLYVPCVHLVSGY